MLSLSALLASYHRAGNWLLPVLRERRELARLPVARIGPCDVHFHIGGGEYLAYFGIAPRRETLRQRALRLCVGLAAGPFGAVLTLQPDGATAGKDTTIQSYNSTLNRGAHVGFSIGYNFGAFSFFRGLIQFPLTSILPQAIIIDATLSLYRYFDRSTNARTMSFYRMKQSWLEGTGNDTATGDGATWNTYDGTHNWQTAGASGANDVESSAIGSKAMPAGTNSGASYATPQWDDISLNVTLVQGWVSGTFANNGMCGRMATEVSDCWQFYSSDFSTASLRPQLVVIYTLPGGAPINPAFSSVFRGPFG